MTSHEGHPHPATKAGRAACRAATLPLAYRTITIRRQAVCANCWTRAANSAEENFCQDLVEKIGIDAATARANNWSDADLAEIDRWALLLLDDAYAFGTICDLHADEHEAYAEYDART